jgi:hypothetical protein
MIPQLEKFLVLLDEDVQRLQVVGQTAEDLVLLQPVGHRDLHRAVKGQLAAMHPREHAEGLLADILALQQLGPEPGAGGFDLPREMDLLRPGEERDLAHLREVHADGIVRPVLDLLGENFLGLARRVEFRLRLDVTLG